MLTENSIFNPIFYNFDICSKKYLVFTLNGTQAHILYPMMTSTEDGGCGLNQNVRPVIFNLFVLKLNIPVNNFSVNASWV